MGEKIDFVITWVDGSQLEWLAEKHKWETVERSAETMGDANADCRYRDNGWLRYWFRSVEEFAPWVNKIHFVTCGQKPDWLNEKHPKLHLVNHEDFIPEAYLPTFSSRTIELNSHRIAELSEQFVMFNDDMFLLQQVTPEYFFKKGNPVLISNLRYPDNIGYSNLGRVAYNDYSVINSSFDIGKSIWANRNKWFNVSALGYKRALRNLSCFVANRTLPVGYYGHLALPHLKSTFEEVWELCAGLMDDTCRHKFRVDNQLNQFLLSAWNQAKGRFYPTYAESVGRCANIELRNERMVCDAIRGQAFPQLCINDSEHNTNSEHCMTAIAEAFDALLPSKSAFEK